MFDPYSVAFEIKNPFKNKNGDKNILITIWHHDPCTDGTDDSCGRFIRSRHTNPDIFKKVQSDFDFNIKNNYWFDKDGKQIFSTIGTIIDMYRSATWIYFKHNRRKINKFMRKHLHNIINFSENPIDCIGDYITNKWNYKNNDERFKSLAAIILADIYRKERKWYENPKWHIHHWKIQFDFLRRFKRKTSIKSNIDKNLRETI